MENILIEQAVWEELQALPERMRRSPLAGIALSLARLLDEGENTGSAAAAAAKELTATLIKLGLITMSPIRETSPNSPHKLDAGDELDKIRKRRNEVNG